MAPRKTTIGLTEDVTVISRIGKKRVTARVDSGATISSIDVDIAAKLRLGPIIKAKTVKSTAGNTRRAVVEAKVVIHGKTMKAEFTIANRSNMKYGMLLGQNILKKGFLIDPSK